LYASSTAIGTATATTVSGVTWCDMGPLGAGALVTSGDMVCMASGAIKYVTAGGTVTTLSSTSTAGFAWAYVAMDINAKVYALDTHGNLYSSPHATVSPVWTALAATYTYPSGSTHVPLGLSVTLEGSVIVSMSVTTTTPSVAVTNYLLGLSMDGTTYYSHSGPASTTSGTAAVYSGLSSIDFLYFNVILNTDHNVYSMDVLRLMHILLPYAAKYLGSML